MSAIQEVMEQLVAEIALRQDCLRGLQTLALGNGVAAADGAAHTSAVRGQVSLAQANRTIDQVGAPLVMAGGRKATVHPVKPRASVVKSKGSRTALVMSVVPSFGGEPFGAVGIHRVLKSVPERDAGWMLRELCKQGKIKLHTKGGPGRPALFTAVGAERGPKPVPQGRLVIPGLDAPEASLQQKLEQALAERDRARTAGQETLERILQDKVNDLQARIEAAK